MSIYSGFATRKDQTNYNNLLQNLLRVMQTHILDFAAQNEVAPHLIKKYHKIITKMQNYEEHKYLPPKFTQSVLPLAHLMGVRVKTFEASLKINQQPCEQEKQTQLQINIEPCKKLSSTQRSFNKRRQPNHRRLKSSQATFQKKEKKIASHRPSTGLCARFNTSAPIIIKRGQSVKKNTPSKFQFYQKHEKKLKQMSQRYNRKFLNLILKKDECRQYNPSKTGTILNTTFRSSKFGSEWLAPYKTQNRSVEKRKQVDSSSEFEHQSKNFNFSSELTQKQ